MNPFSSQPPFPTLLLRVNLVYCCLHYSLTFFPRFRLNVLLTLFLPLSLRDGLSHLKLNTRPGATLKQPSVRPCLTSLCISFLLFLSFFAFVSTAKQNSKIATIGKKALRPTLTFQRERGKKKKKKQQRKVLMTSFSFLYIQV